MTIEKWDPMRDLITIRNRFMELLDRSFQNELVGDKIGAEFWIPPVDFYEGDDEVVVQVELPGVHRRDIEIAVNGNQLVIKGERSTADRFDQAAFHRMERQHGPFKRVLELPVPVDSERIEANYQDGVLVVVLPVHSHSKKKKIKVSAK
jgi:HSP20 family protein